MPESIVYNMDCLDYMRTLPDNYFDLAVADFPYGDASLPDEAEAPDTHTHTHTARRARHGQGKNVRQPDGTWGYAKWRQDETDRPLAQQLPSEREREREAVEPIRSEIRPIQTRQPLRFHGGDRWNKYLDRQILPESGGGTERSVERTGGTWAEKYGKKIIAWDVAPGQEYFDELFRVSRDQVVFGANYFPNMPPTRCFLVWRKLTISESFSMAMAEYAWTSFDGNAKVFECAPQGKKDDPRFHATQKPIELYRWVYNLFAKPGMKIFDPTMGSQSSRLAAWDVGLDYVGCEIDEYYFKLGNERFERYTAQYNLFNEE